MCWVKNNAASPVAVVTVVPWSWLCPHVIFLRLGFSRIAAVSLRFLSDTVTEKWGSAKSPKKRWKDHMGKPTNTYKHGRVLQLLHLFSLVFFVLDVTLEFWCQTWGSKLSSEVDYVEFCNQLGKCPKRDPMMLAAMTRPGDADFWCLWRCCNLWFLHLWLPPTDPPNGTPHRK